ncbi:hypothetical protein C8R46DRAFT_1229548 [Mycena filopes]|nr:hypothetical protein C8R46DRAFT_1229548 [Mycena filopes]
MLFRALRLLLTLALTGAALAVDTETNTTGPHPLITPFSGQTATITQLASGDTRIYYTADDGGIWQIVAHGPFNKAGSFQGNTPLVPANEVHPCSPVVVTSVDGAFADVHVFFFSPKLVVSEYIWANGIGWSGGPGCAKCLTASGFIADSATLLYAAENLAPNAPSMLRVGFLSPGAPGGLSELNKVNGTWQLGVMS